MPSIAVFSLILFEVFRAAMPSGTPDPTKNDGSRETFLKRMDAALASRDPKRLADLSDCASWKEAGYPAVEDLKLTLPPPPLVRDKDLSDSSVLYRDANGRSWMLALRRVESNTWKAVVRAAPCPPGGARSSLPRKPRSQPTPAATTTWTVLECWPLPM